MEASKASRGGAARRRMGRSAVPTAAVVTAAVATALTVTLGGYYCHRRHHPMTPCPAFCRHKLSTIAILNDVRNMMGWVPLRSDTAP